MQLQQTPLRSHGSHEQTQISRLRAWLAAQVEEALDSRFKLAGSRFVPLMQLGADPLLTWAWIHSQQMPRFAQDSLVHGHI